MDCEDARDRLALRPEDLDLPEREALSAHLASCAACRELSRAATARLEAVREAVRKPFPRPARRPWIPLAAAAALILAAWLQPWRTKPVVNAFPAPNLAEAEREWVLGRTGRLALREGGVLRLGAAPILESGVLFAASEEPFTLRAGGTDWILDGSATFEVVPRPLSWIASAWASEPSVRVSVWSGEVKGAGKTLKAGESLGPPLSWKGPAWSALEAPARLKDAAVELEGSLVEVLVRKPSDAAELGVRLSGSEFPLGSALRSGAWTLLRMDVRGGRCRVSAGGTPIVDRPGQGRIGLRAWGGAVELREARGR